MKKMKFAATTLILASSLGSSYADSTFRSGGRIVIDRPSTTDRGDHRSTTGGVVVNDTVVSSTSRLQCQDYIKDFVSLDFLKSLFLEGDFSYSAESGVKNRKTIQIPPYISGSANGQKCLSLDMKAGLTDYVPLDEDENVRYLHLSFRNKVDLNWEQIQRVAGNGFSGNEHLGKTKEQFDRMPMEEKIQFCLMAAGILEQDEDKNLSLKDDYESNQVTVSDAFTFDVQPGDDDITKIRLAGASPYTRANAAHEDLHGGLMVNVPDDNDVTPKCLKLEKLDSDERPIVVYENEILRNAQAVCNSGDVERIDDMLSSLVDNFVNSQAYITSVQVLDAKRKEVLHTTAEEIYDRLEELGQEIKDARRGGEWRIEEETARDLVDEYAENLKRLNSEVYDSYVRELDQLMEQRKNQRGDEKDATDDRIAEINEAMEKLSKNKDKYRLKEVMDLSRHFALTDDARQIHGFYLKSEFLSRVRPSSSNQGDRRRRRNRGSLTFSKADDIIVRELHKFERNLDDWELDADARDGDFYPSRIAEREMQSVRMRMDRMARNFQDQERRIQQYCMGRNPVRCRRESDPRRRANRYRQFQRSQDRLRGRYESLSDTYQRRRGWAEESRRLAQDDDGDFGYYYDDDFYYDRYDSDYSYFDDGYGYEDRYNSGRYNMGANNFMGMNSQMPNPYGQQGPAMRYGGQIQNGMYNTSGQALPYTTSFMPQQQFYGQQQGLMGPQPRFY